VVSDDHPIEALQFDGQLSLETAFISFHFDGARDSRPLKLDHCEGKIGDVLEFSQLMLRA
jgi:hypothetical protein